VGEQCVNERGLVAEAGQQREVNVSRDPWLAPSLHCDPPMKQERHPWVSQKF
jgi:hypothetical protein